MKQNVHVLYIITKLELGGAQKVCLSLLNGIREAGGTTGLISGNQGELVDAVENAPNIYLLPSLQRELSFSAIIQEHAIERRT